MSDRTLKSKRASKKNSPWITYELSRKIHKRNYLKRKATLNNDVTTWQQYKHARNETNNAIRTAKRHYFKDNLEFNKKNPRKTWELINELSLRKCGKIRDISEIRIYDQTIKSAPEMAVMSNIHKQTAERKRFVDCYHWFHWHSRNKCAKHEYISFFNP